MLDRGRQDGRLRLGPDCQCWKRKYDYRNDGWRDWGSLGGYIDSSHKVVTWGLNHQSVVCKGDGGAWRRKKSNGGSNLDGAPSVCAWKERLDMYVKGDDGEC